MDARLLRYWRSNGKLKKEGTVKIPFSWLYDIRQYDNAMNGCYMEITKVA